MLVSEGRMYDLNDLTDNMENWLLREAVHVTEDSWILTEGYPQGRSARRSSKLAQA